MPAYKNSFASPKFFEETILDKDGKKVGTIRIKPSSILWKPASQQQFYSIPLDTFTQWIMSKKTGASRTSSYRERI